MKAHELEQEPVFGLPAELPEGEEIVWQGRPDWRAMARHTFKSRWLASYFVALVALRAGLVLVHGQGAEGWAEVGQMSALFAGCLGLVALAAWLNARATVYTITTRRVVMRIGVALSMSWNLPFRRLAAADLAKRDDEGDIVLRLTEGDKIRAVFLWPHVRFGKWMRGLPTLRSVQEPERVARLLRDAVQEWAEDAQVVIESAPVDAPTPLLPELAEASR